MFLVGLWYSSAGASLFQYNFTSTTPAIGVQPMNAVSASIAALAQGLRCVWIGGAVASVMVITATAGISDVICVNPQIIGTANGIGSIGFVTSVADAVSGTHQHVLHYIPMDDGAYAVANL